MSSLSSNESVADQPKPTALVSALKRAELIDWECIHQIVSITLYVSSRLLNLDFSHRSLLSEKLEVVQIIM